MLKEKDNQTTITQKLFIKTKKMKNFNLKTIGKIVITCCLGIVLSNCEGEDGAVGPAGENGIDGTNGTDGTDGTNGINGVGFDELAKYGNITLTLEGTRPDNDEAFTDTLEFNFYQTGYNNWINTEEGYIEFDFTRFLDVPNSNYQGSSLNLNLEISNPGEENQEIELHTDINNYPLVLDDLSYFNIRGNYYKSSSETSNFSITNYTFDEATNNLSFSFSFDIDGSDNDTGNDLIVSGEVNVIVFKNITPEITR